MGTPMHVYAEIAARHGVVESDEEAVDVFFAETLLHLPRDAQQKILRELMARDGEVRKAAEPPREMTPEIGLADLVKKFSEADLYGQFLKHCCAQYAEASSLTRLTPSEWLQKFAEFVANKAVL